MKKFYNPGPCFLSEKKSNLTDEGREMKKLLNKGPRQRVAHTPNYDPSILKKSPPARWTGFKLISYFF